MKYIIALVGSLLLSCSAFAQDTLAYWAQNNNELPTGGNGFTISSFPMPADEGEGLLYLENYNPDADGDGVLSYIKSFAGTTTNRIGAYPSGGSLSPQGGADTSNNGMSIVFEVNTEGYQQINVSWAQRGTSTGFSSREFAYSTDGSSFTTVNVDSGTLSGWETAAFDLTDEADVNDQASVYFRITLDGATSTAGNNRFDNITVTGVSDEDAARMTVYRDEFSEDPYKQGWTQVSVSGTESWDWNGSFDNVSFAPFIDGACRANDSWFISPVFDFDAQTAEQVAVEVARGFGGTNGLEIYYSTSYQGDGVINPSDWVLLDTLVSDDFTSNNVPTRFEGLANAAELEGQVHFAFRYAFNDGNCSTWRVAAFEITAEAQNNLAEFACGAPANPIHQVQGAGFQSPVQGAYVQVEAVVTQSFQDTSNGGLGGFYLQELQGDGNPLTSEGIFVYDGGQGDAVQPGDIVRVGGYAQEYFGQTQLSDIDAMALCGSAPNAVAPVSFELPVTDYLAYEAVEGMLTTLPQQLTVSDVYNALRYGEITVSNGRIFQPTQVARPGDEADAVLAANALNTLVIDNARGGSYRQPYLIGADGLTPADASNPVRAGYTLEPGFTAVMGYSFGAYRLRSLETPAFDSEANERPLVVPFTYGSDRGPRRQRYTVPNLRVASFNVENLFATLSVSGSECGPNGLSCRGAETSTERDRQFAKVAAAILDMDADVIAINEIENDADDATLALLVAELNAQSRSPAWRPEWSFIATGYLGTDAIKPAFIYRSSRVMPRGDYAVLDSSVDPEFDTSRQRPALAQRFHAYNSGEFTAVAVHLRAKGSCPSSSDVNADQGDGQGCWNQWRTDSAAALARWIETNPTQSSNNSYLILGDFNAYAMEDPLVVLSDAGYTNLEVAFNGGNPEVYSYVFQGQAGSLDHVFASPEMATQVLNAAAWHINADEIPAFGFQERLPSSSWFKSPELYQADAFRSSDHDPIVIDLRLSRTCGFGLSNRPSHPRGRQLPQPRCAF